MLSSLRKLWREWRERREPGVILKAFSQVILIFGGQEDGNNWGEDLRKKLKMSKCKLNLRFLHLNNLSRVKHCFENLPFYAKNSNSVCKNL